MAFVCRVSPQEDHPSVGPLREPQRLLHLPGRDRARLVDDEDGLFVELHAPSCEERRKGPGLDAVLAERSDLAGVRSDRDDMVAMLLGERLGSLEHVALPRPGVTLDPYDPIRSRDDELHSLTLALREAARGELQPHMVRRGDRGELAPALALDLQDALLALKSGRRGVPVLGGDEPPLADGLIHAFERFLPRGSLLGQDREPRAAGLGQGMPARGRVQGLLADKVAGAALPIDLLLDVRKGGGANRVLQRDVEQLPFLDNRLALGEMVGLIRFDGQSDYAACLSR